MSEFNQLLQVPSTGILPDVGKILVATPYFNDTFFNRSVVLLTDFDKEQTAGLIVNKKLPCSVRSVVSELRVDENAYFGGPVLTEAIFLIHNFASCSKASLLLPDVYVGYDQILISLIEHKAIVNMKYRFLLGYAGWAPGQLENELLNDMWVVADASHSLLFNTPAEKMWHEVVKSLGAPFEHWLQVPEKLSYN